MRGLRALGLWAICCMAGMGLGRMGAERVELVAGGGTERSVGPIDAKAAKLILPFGVEFDRAGRLVFVEMAGGERICRVDGAGVLRVIGGDGVTGFRGDGGPALEARFNGMHNLAIAPSDEIYVSDTWNNRVRRWDPATGVMSTIAGTGEKGFSGDGGRATSARFSTVIQIALDAKGEVLYVADIDNRRVRRIRLKTGIVETVAGNGGKGVPKEGGVAREEPLVDPRAVVEAADGTLYVLERGGHALRRVDRAGRIWTVAGTGKPGYSGDGGPARAAELRGPKHLCVDRDGSVLIADTDNHVIRRYDPRGGGITTVVGTGRAGFGGVGRGPLEVELNQPHGITVHRDGDWYIADSHNHRVLRVVRK